MSPGAAPLSFRAEPWLESPLRTGAGEVQLAGMLRDVPGIDPGAMRVLGSYALVLLVEGKGYYRDARGGEAALQAGDVVLVFPELAHAYGPVAGGGWTQIYFVFQGPQFDLWRRKGLLRPERAVWRLGAPDYWRQRLGGVLRSERLLPEMAAWRAMGRLLDVMAEMAVTDAQGREAVAGEVWLEQSLRLLGEPRGAAWPTPQAVARDVGLSYENFRKRFVALTGESPGRYQKRRRLERAGAAIYQGEQSLKEIADELGFCDVFHFSKAFKQVMGLTPSEYRMKVRGK